VPLLDAQRALRTVRLRSQSWNCDPGKVGIIGFSAGGHLASTAATHFDEGVAGADDPIERVGCRPDFAVLVYPVITMGDQAHLGSRANLLGPDPAAAMIEELSNEKQVTARTPPVYLTHALDDRVVPPDHSRLFYEALQAQKVPTEYLELPSGDHGLNGYQGPMWDAWQTGVLKWLETRKFLDGRVGAADLSQWKYSGSLCLLTTPEGAHLAAAVRLENFPVLVRLDRGTFDFGQARPGGEDLRFSVNGRLLSHQIDEWDADRGAASVWVLFPVVEGNTMQEFTMHWGCAEALDESRGEAVFSPRDGHASVLHLDESLRDEAGALVPSNAGSTVVPGLIGAARRFRRGQGVDGGGHIMSYPFGNQSSTTEAWVRPEAGGSAALAWGRYATRFNGNTGDGNEVALMIGSPPVPSWASDGPAGAVGSVPLVMGQWSHLAATYDGVVSSLYVNGRLAGSRHQPSAMSMMNDVQVTLGGMRGEYTYVGDIDEVRVSRRAHSAGWLQAHYENQKPLQSLVGILRPPGHEFSVTPAALTVREGQSATVTAQAGGARKIYWLLQQDGAETVVAVDRLTCEIDAGRMVADRRATLQLKAVYDDGVKLLNIPVTLTEAIPEPVVSLQAPATWNGRETIEIVPVITNHEAMKAAGAGTLRYEWSVTGGAVIKQVASDRLVLQRSQFSGMLSVRLVLDNGGPGTVAEVPLEVVEPAVEEWASRTPEEDEHPEEGQFYARNDRNHGLLHDRGRVATGVDEVILTLYGAEGALVLQEKQRPAADGRYAFAIPLSPGLVRYTAVLGTRSGGVETVVRTAGGLMCGDAYIIQGQSNAEATGPNNGPSEDELIAGDEWIRSYGNQYDGTGRGAWGQAVRTHIWGRPDYGNHQIGTWGMVLARRLVENYRIPICMMNGAVGGTRIDQHQRDDARPDDAATIYGRLLSRMRAARLTHGIRAVLWHQGENNQGAASPTGDYDWKSYQRFFIDLTAAWKQDFPNIQNYYVWQIWPSGCNMGGTPAGDMLLEVQRTLPSLFSNLRIMPTMGIVSGSSGRGLCHFDAEGYAQIAELMRPLLERDHYGWMPEEEVTAPSLRSAVFTSAARDEIVLDFGQPMVWHDGMKKLIYLDNQVASVRAGRSEGHTIRLQLEGGSKAAMIGYLAGRDWDGSPVNLWRGRNDVPALAFCDVPVTTAAEKGQGIMPVLDRALVGYETRSVEGWTVHLSDALLARHPEAVESAMPLLQKQLQEICRVVPAPVRARLQQVPLWFSPEYSLVPGRAEYHPGADWLQANGRNPAMVKGVEFTNARIFERETSRMPNFALHELAHAYHDRELGFDDPGIMAAFEQAKQGKLYDRVARRHGQGRPETMESAYAMTNQMEYFAELTEAVFSTNDFYPFTRDELAAHDPVGMAAVLKAWKVD
jgi:dienelactone hydrolase